MRSARSLRPTITPHPPRASGRTQSSSPPTNAARHRVVPEPVRRCARAARRGARRRRACRPRATRVTSDAAAPTRRSAWPRAAPRARSSRSGAPPGRSISGSDTTGDVPGLRRSRARRSRPRRPARAPGGTCSSPRNSAPGSSTAAQSRPRPAARRRPGAGATRWSTERAPHASATGTERFVLNCSTCARRSSAVLARPARPSGAGARSRRRSTRRRCRAREAPSPRRRGQHRLDLVHPAVGVVAVGDRVREQRGRARASAATSASSRAASRERAQLAPRRDSP